MKKRLITLFLSSLMILNCFVGCSPKPGIIKDNNEERGCASIAEKYESKLDSNNYGDSSVMYCVEAECCDEAAAPMFATVSYGTDNYNTMDYNTENYDYIEANGFCDAFLSPLSTFSADVDTASYSNVRRMLNNGYSIENIPDGAVRTEEFLNYFSYDYSGPEAGEPFGVNAQIAKCPWNPDHDLLMLGLQTEAVDFSDAADSNIVFLIDVSGSMYDDNKLPLLIQSFELMIDNLSEKDTVSIVTYASGNEVVIEGVPASDKDTICEALESLQAGGSTNGAGGIVTAYELAEENFISGGNNRVIIATDGDFNVGLTNESDLHDLITEEKDNGIYLSCLGFGMGNYNDVTMETLADDGNGNYAYIDSISEANKVLVEELGANMVTVAKDVKLQIEFNPEYVSEYRLIGYENRVMDAEDFDDDTKDAGEIGAGHSVTVMYEIVPAGENNTDDDDLKYQDSTVNDYAKNTDEWCTLSVRYKEPESDSSELLEYYFGNDDYTDSPSNDFVFASCVAEYAMVLTESEYLADGSLAHVQDILDDLNLNDQYKEEFKTLVDVTY